MNCWLCDRPVEDPPQIIGHWHAMDSRVAHRRCLQTLGELDLDLRVASAGPELDSRQVPGRP